jgi:hypothetical protein
MFVFFGKRNGIDFHLNISKNHPALTNIRSHLDKKESERFYLITGFAEPTKLVNNHYSGYVDRNDKITFTQFNT